MPELSAVAVSTAVELTTHKDSCTDSDLTEHADEALDVLGNSLPVLGDCREVCLVVDEDRKVGNADRKLGNHRDLVPAEVRSTQQGARFLVDEARQRDGPAYRHKTLACNDVKRLSRKVGKPIQDGARLGVPIVGLEMPLVTNGARQVLDAEREVVDVHFKPDRNDPVGELERLSGTPHPARARVLPGLAEEFELDEFTNEARDRSARQSGLGGDAGT